MTPQQLDAIADATNPLLLAAFLLSVGLSFPTLPAARPFLLRCGLALLITYGFAHFKQWFSLWPEFGDFPSGHMAFLLTVSACFFFLHKKSLRYTIPLAVLYGWLIVFLGYHTWWDLLGSFVLALPVTAFCMRGRPRAPDIHSTGQRQSVLFVAGDLSGDMHTSRLAARLALTKPDVMIHALGSPRLGTLAETSGGRWVGDTSYCSAIGITAVFGIYLRARWLDFKLKRFVITHRVDVAVLCDWGGFNCRQLDLFSSQKIPVLYSFPPRSWQRGGSKGLQFAHQVARVATPFEWSAERVTAIGCHATWVGHALLELRSSKQDRDQLRKEFGIGPNEKLVVLLPGSRSAEIKILAPRLAAAAAILADNRKIKFLVPVPEPLVALAQRHFPTTIPILAERAQDCLVACDVAVVKTGSATLEAVVADAPQVAIYDLGWCGRFEWMVLWMWRNIPFIAMPNILLQRALVPELIGIKCRPDAIAAAASHLLTDEGARTAIRAGYIEIRKHLGESLPLSATDSTLVILCELLDKRRTLAFP